MNIYKFSDSIDNTKEYKFNPGSVIIDPYRELKEVKRCNVVHYGNSNPSK